MKKILALTALALLLAASLALAQLGSVGPTNNTLQVQVKPEASFTITTGTTTSLSSTGTNFNPYTGTTSFTYYVRTTKSGGSGSIQLKVTTDFVGGAGGTGPSAASTTDPLTYITTRTGTGTAVSDTASTTDYTKVVDFGEDNRSAKAGDSGSVAWSLVNDPQYETDTYSAVVTFTISAA